MTEATRWGGNWPEGEPLDMDGTPDEVMAQQLREARPHMEKLKELLERARAAKRGEISVEELRRFRRRNMEGLVPLLKSMECALRVKAREMEIRGERILGKRIAQHSNR